MRKSESDFLASLDRNQITCIQPQNLESSKLMLLTVPVLPRFAPVKTSMYTVMKRDTVPTKNDRVLTVTVLPRCNPCLGPGSITVSSRCRPVSPGITTVHPGTVPIHTGGIPVHPGGVPDHPSGARVIFWCLPALKTIATGVNRDGTGVNRDATGVNWGTNGVNRGQILSRFALVASQFTPMKSRFTPALFHLPTVCAGSSRFITVESWCCHGLSWCGPGLTRFLTSLLVRPGLPRFY